MRFKVVGLVAFVMLMLPGLAGAEEQLVERTVCVLDFTDLSAEGERVAGIGAVLRESLEMELANRGFQISLDADVASAAKDLALDGDALLVKANATRVAANAGADVLVSGFFTIEGDYLGIGVVVYDLVTKRPAVALSAGGKAGVELYDTVDSIGPKIAEPMRQALKPLPASQITVEREQVTVKTEVVERVESIGTKVPFTILSQDEGARVFIADSEVGTIKDGKFETEIVSGSSVDVRIELYGYYPQTKRVNFKTKARTLKFSLLTRRPWVELGVNYNIAAPFGLGAAGRAYAVPDFIYSPFYAGVHVIPQSYTLGDPFNVQAWRFELATGLGMYLFMPAQWPVRAWIEGRGVADILVFGATPVSAMQAGFDLGYGLEFNAPRFLIYLANRFKGMMLSSGPVVVSSVAPIISVEGGINWKL